MRINADIEHEAEAREAEAERREQAQRETTNGWVRYFEDRLGRGAAVHNRIFE